MTSVVNRAERVAYVTDNLYGKLKAVVEHDCSGMSESDPSLRTAAEPLLYREARLLDHRLYMEWLSLFHPECIYWVPASQNPQDPRSETSIHLDDHRRLADRIALINTGYLHAQTPPSRTRRMLSNVEAWQGDGDADTLVIRSNFVIWEYRKTQMSQYVGWQEHHTTVGDDGTRRIKYKIIRLLDCDAAHGNITFIL